jgi:GAF domain-containing protein
MADAPSPLPTARDELAPVLIGPRRWLALACDALCLLVRSLRRLARLVVRGAPTSELFYVLAQDAVWLLGADSSMVFELERDLDLQPAEWPALAQAWRPPERTVAPLAATTTFIPAIEPSDLSGVIGRLVYPGRPGAVVRLTAPMVGTDLMAAYPWTREHGWSARN